MDFSFQTRELRSICEDENKAQEQYGISVSSVLKKRLSDLRAAPTLSDIPVGNLRRDSASATVFVIDLTEGFGLQFRTLQSNIDIGDSEEVDLSDVYRIKLLAIGENDV